MSETYNQSETQEIIKDLCELSKADGQPIEQSDQESTIRAIVDNVHKQISGDSKSKELKKLQGKIWKRAFEAGTIKGHLFC